MKDKVQCMYSILYVLYYIMYIREVVCVCVWCNLFRMANVPPWSLFVPLVPLPGGYAIGY